MNLNNKDLLKDIMCDRLLGLARSRRIKRRIRYSLPAVAIMIMTTIFLKQRPMTNSTTHVMTVPSALILAPVDDPVYSDDELLVVINGGLTSIWASPVETPAISDDEFLKILSK